MVFSFLIKQGRQERSLNALTKEDEKKPDVDPWISQKAAILSKYTTSEKISIVTSFLSDGEKGIS